MSKEFATVERVSANDYVQILTGGDEALVKVSQLQTLLLTPAEIASPSAAVLADKTATYLDTSTGLRYVSNGTSLQGLQWVRTQQFSNNHYVGDDAGNLTGTGVNNTALGWRALRSTVTALDSVAIGSEAMKDTQSGVGNVGIGRLALTANVTGGSNVGLGDSALRFSKADGNTAVGFRAAETNVAGKWNVFMGAAAGVLRTGGDENTIIGYAANSIAATGGNGNTALGFQALRDHAGDDCTAIGHNSLQTCTGIRNTAVGLSSGGSITSGLSNTFVGWSAGTNPLQLATAFDSMALGQQAYTTKSNQVVIGASTVLETVLRGAVILGGLQTPASATAPGVAGTVCADANYVYVCTATNTWKRVAVAAW